MVGAQRKKQAQIQHRRAYRSGLQLIHCQPATESSMQRSSTASPSAGLDTDRLFARMSTVLRLTGLGRSTIYRLIAEDKFPAQVRIGTRAVGWRWSDLERWSAARPTITH
jgi:prophage regulatory protein